MSNLFKNFIISGDADYHCLVCDETFISLIDVDKHIRWENHRKKWKSQTYIPKYKKDAIFKIGNYYYCEVCNYTIKDDAAVETHINEDKHKINIEYPEKVIKLVIGKHSDYGVKLDNLYIDKYQWHGIVGLRCFLCNVIVKSYYKHILIQDHVINLIQTEIKRENGEYYRMIKDNFQCFKCKSVYSTAVFEEHWSNVNHFTKISKIEKKETNEVIVVDTKRKRIENFINDTQNKFFDFNNTENNMASCKVCKELVKSDSKFLIEHIMNLHSDVKVTEIGLVQKPKKSNVSKDENVYKYGEDHGKRRSELAKFGKQNSIKLNAGGSKGYCTICDRMLAPHINIFTKHIKGAIHLGHMELKGLINLPERHNKNYISHLPPIFIASLIHLKDIKSFWINKYYTVENNSFMLLNKVEHGLEFNKVKCYACDEMCPLGTEYKHCKTIEHKTNFFKCLIIASHVQFVREIRPYSYHCGFCNELFPFSETLEKHLMCPRHSLKHKDAHKYISYSRHHVELMSKDNDIMYKNCLKAVFEKS